jgi:hypothetical protein
MRGTGTTERSIFFHGCFLGILQRHHLWACVLELELPFWQAHRGRKPWKTKPMDPLILFGLPSSKQPTNLTVWDSSHDLWLGPRELATITPLSWESDHFSWLQLSLGYVHLLQHNHRQWHNLVSRCLKTQPSRSYCFCCHFRV